MRKKGQRGRGYSQFGASFEQISALAEWERIARNVEIACIYMERWGVDLTLTLPSNPGDVAQDVDELVAGYRRMTPDNQAKCKDLVATSIDRRQARIRELIES